VEYSFSIHELGPQPIVSIRERRRTADIPEYMGRAFGTLFARLDELAIRPAGPPFAIYHEFSESTVDAEVCVPVPAIVVAGDSFESRQIPAATVVRTLHVGPYAELGDAYDAITSWLTTHEAEACGPIRERYLNGPGDGVEPAAYATEVEVPIQPVRLAMPV
jgi:effector-binding domain-containing protein